MLFESNVTIFKTRNIQDQSSVDSEVLEVSDIRKPLMIQTFKNPEISKLV